MARWVWREAMDLLGRVMPGSSGFLLDQLAGIPSDAWSRFRQGEDDVTSGERLRERIGTALGNDLFVVTDASWRPDIGPFVLPSWRLTGLIREHVDLTSEPFFTGDLVILSPDEGVLVALHRAGLLALAHGNASPRPALLPLAHLSDSSVFADWPAELEWRHPFGEIYPETEVSLPSGRVVGVRWFEADARVSFAAPTGDFQIAYRGDPGDIEAVYREFIEVAGLTDADVQRLSVSH